MDPFSIMALGTAVAGGVTSLIGANKANRTNERIAKETREFNLSLYKRQLEDQRALKREEREYNSPLEQRKRLEQAGYNPYLQNLETGNVSGATAPTPAPATPYQYVNPFEGVANSAMNVSSLMMQQAQTELIKAQAQKVRSETKGVEVDNLFKTPRYEAELKKLGVDTATAEVLLNRQSFEFEEFKTLTPERMELFLAQVDSAKETLRALRLDTALKEFELKSMKPAELEVVKNGIKEGLARISQIKETTRLTSRQVSLAVAQIAKVYAETEGVKLNNYMFNDTYEFIYKSKEMQYMMDKWRLTFGLKNENEAHVSSEKQRAEQTRGMKLQNDFFEVNKLLMPLVGLFKSW